MSRVLSVWKLRESLSKHPPCLARLFGNFIGGAWVLLAPGIFLRWVCFSDVYTVRRLHSLSAFWSMKPTSCLDLELVFVIFFWKTARLHCKIFWVWWTTVFGVQNTASLTTRFLRRSCTSHALAHVHKSSYIHCVDVSIFWENIKTSSLLVNIGSVCVLLQEPCACVPKHVCSLLQLYT